jgi:hypothetical protein
MPNWCYNYVSFSGKEEDLIKLQEVFSEMIKQEGITNEGQLPEFAKISEQLDLNRWFFQLNDNGDFGFTYETKWAPNTLNLVAIADLFNLEFESEYEEGGCLIYGKAFYKNKILEELDLDRSDLLQISGLENTEDGGDYYLYQGEKYESDNEIKEIIWNKKFKKYEKQY